MNSVEIGHKLNALHDEINRLRIQNNQYDFIFNKLNIGMVILKNHVIAQVNDKLSELLKTNKSSLVGKPFIDYCSVSQSSTKSFESITEALFLSLKENVSVCNCNLHGDNGFVITCDLIFSSLNQNDDIIHYIEVYPQNPSYLDINNGIPAIANNSIKEQESLNEELRATLDELVEVNSQLSDSESWNKSIVENIPIGLIVFNNQQVEYLNSQFASLLGYPTNEAEFVSSIKASAPEFVSSFKSIFETFKHSSKITETEFWIKSTLNHNIFIRSQFVKIREGRWMILITDLTADKNKEIELHDIKNKLETTIITLRESEQRFGAVVTNSPVVFSSVTNDGIFTLSEGHGLDGMGFKPGQVVGMHVKDVFSNYPEIIQIIEKALNGQIQNELFYLKDRVYDTYLSPIFDNKGDVRSIVAVSTDVTERHGAEERLRFSEERFRTIVQHLSDIIFIIDKDLRIIYESPSVERALGYNKGELIGMNGLSLIHDDDLVMVKDELNKVITKTNDYLPTELRIRHKQGHWVYLDIIGDNLIDHPSIGGLLVTARDISERKNSERQLSLYQDHLEQLVKQRTEEIEHINGELISINEELKVTNEELANKNDILNIEIIKRIEAQLLLEESENKFRSFIEQSTEGIALIDEEGKFVDWNKGMESIFRIEKADIINTYAWEFDYRFIQERRKTPAIFEELKNSIIDYLAHLDKTKVLTAEGVFTTLELKQKILSITTFPVITPNRKYVGRLVRDITVIKRAQEEIREQAAELQEINTNLEMQKAELEKTLEELRRAQVQLIQAEKMASLGVLTAGVAHEINNPVNFINSALEGLRITLDDFLQIFESYQEINSENINTKLTEVEELKTSLDYPMLHEGIDLLLNNMQTGISRITEIVRSLRTFSRIEENELRLSDIHEIIDTALVILQNQYRNRIEIIRKYSVLRDVVCYPGKLSQVFMNLFSNSIHAIHGKGYIEIETKVNTDFNRLEIFVRDSGIGIPLVIKEKIFEPFFTTKEAGRGTGLGLSITYGIIQQHKGLIDVTSKEGEGTEFFIAIPLDL
jgi:PAS domain S-box-containing protein